MKNVALEPYSVYCRQFISDYISSYLNHSVYACELGRLLTQGINIDGSATYSTHQAILYLHHWWDDCANYWEYEKLNFGEHFHNPFSHPEAYHVCMIIEGVCSILSQCSVITNNWNNQLKITQKTINKIKSEIKGIEVVL